MDKKIRVLKNKMCCKKDVSPQILKYLCGYDSNYEVIDNLLVLMNDEINNINSTSTRKDYRQLYMITSYISKLLPLTYIEDTTTLIRKIEKIGCKVDRLIEEITDNNDINKFLITLSKKISKLLREIDDLVSNPDKEQQDNIRQAKELLYYAIFENKDYNNLHDMLKHFKQYDDIIYQNMADISVKLVDGYTTSLLKNDKKLNNYYYLVFMYLTSEPKYGFNNYKDEVVRRLEVTKNLMNDLELSEQRNNEYRKELDHLIRICLHDYTSLETKYQINLAYSHDMLDEIACLKTTSYDKVLDLRDKYVVTIDGKSTLCYDDACSFEVLPNGNYLVGVYIADVNRVVKAGSLIDQYAYNLGQTIYVNNNILMLPHNISLESASLNRIGSKYVHAHLFEVTPQYDIVDTKVCNAIIQVKDRLSYNDVDNIVKQSSKSLKGLTLKGLSDFAEFLRKSNPNRINYIKEKEKKKTEKKEQEQYQQCYGTNIVSELKVLTNTMLAGYAFQHNCPFIYRVNVKHNKESEIKRIKDTLNSDSRFDEVISILAAQYDDSYYSSQNIGHAGIGIKAYAHGTTPLRNYSSLFNQRIIQRLMIDGNITDKEVYELEREVPIVAEHLNGRIILDSQYREESWKQKKKSLTK